MSKSKVLVIDDDASVRRVIRRVLELENISVFEAENGRSGLRELLDNYFDLAVLDINMDDMDGYEVLNEIRRQGINTPVFLLSGRDADYDMISGYRIGADAYITKPFSPAVLSAMIKSQIIKNKRMTHVASQYIDLPPFRFDKNNFLLYKDGVEVPLSSKESKMVRFFMENSGKVFTKDQIYENIWNDAVVSDNTIMVFIRKLRTKIEDDPNNPKYLKTVWGIGYTFTVEKE